MKSLVHISSRRKPVENEEVTSDVCFWFWLFRLFFARSLFETVRKLAFIRKMETSRAKCDIEMRTAAAEEEERVEKWKLNDETNENWHDIGSKLDDCRHCCCCSRKCEMKMMDCRSSDLWLFRWYKSKGSRGKCEVSGVVELSRENVLYISVASSDGRSHEKKAKRESLTRYNLLSLHFDAAERQRGVDEKTRERKKRTKWASCERLNRMSLAESLEREKMLRSCQFPPLHGKMSLVSLEENRQRSAQDTKIWKFHRHCKVFLVFLFLSLFSAKSWSYYEKMK